MIWSAVPWKLVGYGVLAAAVGLLTWRVIAWHSAYEALPGVEAALAAEVACGEGSQCQARQAALQAAQAAKTAEVIGDYERELADLRNRPIPVRTVRLCAGTGNVQGSRPTGAADGAGAPASVVPEAPGRDIGPDLYQLAREADEVAARLRGLQQWNEALAR